MKTKYIIVCSLLAILLGGVLFKACVPSQSGIFSRWTGKPVKLPAPKDCVRIVSMGKTANTKYLSYITSDGRVILREYSDYGVLEATYELEGARFDTSGINKNPGN